MEFLTSKGKLDEFAKSITMFEPESNIEPKEFVKEKFRVN